MPTRISKQGQIVEKETPTGVNQQAEDAGQGTPSSPVGAEAVPGTTPKQQDMTGTPAQQQGAIQQTGRGQQTLQKAQRYQKAAPGTSAQEQATQAVQTLEQLGPVKANIQGLIQQRIQQAQQQTAQLGLNQQAIQNIQDPTQRAQAQQALNTYLSDPSEANLQTVYDTLGRAQTEDISTFFTGAPEAIQQAVQPELVGEATLDTLALEDLGTSAAEIGATLGIPEQEVGDMTLDELNQRIQAFEAQELSRQEQLQATLSDPTTPPQQKQAARQELRQMGAVGVTGAEQQIDQLQEQVDTAQQIRVAGRDMSLEEALSDEGLSALISQASYDDELLEAMAEDPQYADMADWITSNRDALQELSEEYETEAADFLQVQDEYQQVKEALGQDSAELFNILTGQQLQDSILSGELETLQQDLQDNPLYQAAATDERFREALKASPELAQEFADAGLNEEQIQSSIDVHDALQQDQLFQDLVGEDVEYITDPNKLVALKQDFEAVSELSPSVREGAQLLQESDVDLSVDMLQDIDASDDPDTVVNSLLQQKQLQDSLQYRLDSPQEMKEEFFGSSDWSVRDLNAVLEGADQETQDLIKNIFDVDGEGGITQDELDSEATLDNFKEAVGAGQSYEDIIAGVNEGEPYSPNDILMKLMDAGITGEAFEKQIVPKIKNKVKERKAGISSKIEQAEQAAASAQDLLAKAGVPVEGNTPRELRDSFTQYTAQQQERLSPNYRELMGEGEFAGRGGTLQPNQWDSLAKQAGVPNAPLLKPEDLPNISDDQRRVLQQLSSHYQDRIEQMRRNPAATQQDMDWMRGRINSIESVMQADKQYSQTKERLNKATQAVRETEFLRKAYNNFDNLDLEGADEQKLLEIAERMGAL